MGWQETVLVVCPINPFEWPVKASVAKFARTTTGAYKDSHYRSVYFHNCGPEADRKYQHYLTRLRMRWRIWQKLAYIRDHGGDGASDARPGKSDRRKTRRSARADLG